MKTDYTKLIDRYLSGEMSTTEQHDFEQQLATNETLKAEVELQQSIYEVAQRASFRNTVKQTAKNYHFFNWLKWIGVSVLALLAVVTALMLVASDTKDNEKEALVKENENDEPQLLTEPTLINNLPRQVFTWGGKDTLFVSENGVLVSVPATALLKDGVPYTDAAIVEWQEAMDGASIMKAGLSTMADSNLLETQGMFSLRITDTEGNELAVNPAVGVYVQAPVDTYKPGMQLYDGEYNQDSIINWVNPVPLEKIPVPIPMSELNFYPAGYEDTLDNLKLSQEKEFRDSLYLACEPINSFDSFSGKDLFHGLCATCHHPNKDRTGPKLQNVRQKWKDGGANRESIYQWVQNWQKVAVNDPYASQVASWSPTAMSQFEYLTKNDIRKIFDYVDNEYNENDKPEREKTQEVFSLSQKKDGIEPTSFYGEIIKGRELNNIVNTEATLVYNRYQENYEIIVDVLLNSDFLFLSDSENVLTLESLNKSSEIKYITPTQIYSEGRGFINVDQFQKSELKGEHRLIRKFRYGSGKFKKPISFEFTFILCNSNGECHLRTQVIKFNPKTDIFKHIPPSNVLSFWNPTFDNTILATREFERRMQSIHGICKEELLAKYIKNIDKPMWFTDSILFKRGHKEFEMYFAERVGGMDVSNAHLSNLMDFYSTNTKSLQEKMKALKVAYEKEGKKNTEKLVQERINQGIRAEAMNNKTIQEETQFNLKSKPRNNTFASTNDLSFNTTELTAVRQVTRSVGFNITQNNAIKNIDRKVADATLARRNIKGNFMGKKIDVRYNDFSISIETPELFSHLFVYLLPDKFDSYQRLTGKKGSFSYRLNDAINYDIVVLGINKEGYFYHEIPKVRKGNFTNIILQQVTEERFNRNINSINKQRLDKPSLLQDEIAWLKLEKEHYEAQRQREEKRQFLERMRKVVFPCYENSLDENPEDLVYETANMVSDVEVVAFPDVEAIFPGGAESLRKYISKNISYPQEAIENNIQGKVFVEFEVDELGNVVNPIVISSPSKILNESALKLVNGFPKYQPAVKNGRNVRSRQRIPIDFKLD